MTEQNLEIYGEGKGGGGHTPTEAKDSLVSEQTVKTLFAVSEGIIQSVDDIFLDQVRIDNYDVEWTWRQGFNNQTVINGFVDVEAPSESFTPITMERGTTKKPEKEPVGFTPNEYFATVDPSADAARLTFLINTLKRYEEDGDLVGSKITFEIYTRPNLSSPWALNQTITKKGKTTNGYAFDVTIDKPAGTTLATVWEIKVIRITPDDGTVKINRVITWQALTEIWYQQKPYNNTALVGITLTDAKKFGNRVPEIMFRVKGRRLLVPDNYDPVNRTYTGTWTGEFNTLFLQYTNNPAWILYDVLHDERCGLGIPQADIDIYSLYQLSQYADQQIPSGSISGGTIPRYTLDYQFIYRDAPQKMLSQILSICNANIIINEFGQISVTFLKENLPVKRNVTNQNVIDGIFTYTSTDIEQRTNLVNVTYNNGNYFGRTNTVTVQDDALIDRYGLQPMDVALPGCYYEAQAIRKARAILYMNCFFTNIINFGVLFEGLTYKIGDIIRVFDNYNQNVSQSGIVLSVATVGGNTVLTLDREVTLTDATNTFRIYKPDGTEVTKTLSAGTYSTITLTGIVDVNPQAVFIIEGAIVGRLYRVIAINKSEEEIYTITASEYVEDMYAYINEGIVIDTSTGDFVNFNDFDVLPVTNLTVTESYGTNGVAQVSNLHVDWEWNTTNTVNYKAYYRIVWNREDKIDHTVDNIAVTDFDLENPYPGTYTFTVYAIHPFTGLMAPPVTISYDYRVETGTSTLYPPVNVRVTGTTGLEFSTPSASVSWDFNPANVAVSDALYDYVVELWDKTGTTKQESYTVQPIVREKAISPLDPDEEEMFTPFDGLFELTFAENIAQFGSPQREFQLKIYSRDTVGDLSLPVTVNIVNPVPALVNWEVTPTFDGAYIKITPSTEYDVTEYIIYRGTTPGFTKNDASIIYAGPDTYLNIQADAGVTYYYALGVADSFGRTGINISTEQSAVAISVDTDVYTYTGLTFLANHKGPQLNPDVNYQLNAVYWTAFQAYKNGVLVNNVNAGFTTWTTGTLYLYFKPGSTSLLFSTNLVNAIADGGRILATYRGGSDLQHDEGKAFVSGDQILAGTVGANTLVTNTAVITNGAQIGNVLESTNYNPITKQGWRIDKDGWIQANDLTLYDSAGNIILSSTTKAFSGNVTGTINNVSAATISTAATNFNASNDRNNTAIVAPTILTNGTAIDHTLQANASADISFEWSWSGNEGDIDGFQIFVYQSASSASYAFSASSTPPPVGSNPAAETVYEIPANKRAFILFGVAPALYYTFGVRAYRSVDKDINANGVIVSSLVQPGLAAENPYRPESNTAFSGNVSGTVNNIPATNINVWSQISGTGKPVDNATRNSIFRQGGTVPAGANGDIWYVTSTTTGYDTGATYLYVGGSWQRTSDATLSRLAGGGVNVCNFRYTSFEEDNLPPITITNGSVALDTSVGYFGSKSLRLTATAADCFSYLATNSDTYNINITPNKKWIISMYVRSNKASAFGEVFIRTSAAGVQRNFGFTTSATINTWTRISGVIDLSSDNSTTCLMRVDNEAGAGFNMWFDGLMMEEQVGELTTPSAYAEAQNFLSVYKGSLQATQNASLSGSGTPSSGLGTTGDSYFDSSTGLMWWKGASGWQKVMPQITGGVGGNAPTFIATGAIGQAQIGNASIGTAQIIDANITTLKIGANQVTVPQVFVGSNINTVISGTDAFKRYDLFGVCNLETVAVSASRLIFVSFTLVHRDSSPGSLALIAFVKGSQYDVKHITPENWLMNGVESRQTYTISFDGSTIANETISVSMSLDFTNGNSGYQWNAVTSPQILSPRLFAFTGKR